MENYLLFRTPHVRNVGMVLELLGELGASVAWLKEATSTFVTSPQDYNERLQGLSRLGEVLPLKHLLYHLRHQVVAMGIHGLWEYVKRTNFQAEPLKVRLRRYSYHPQALPGTLDTEPERWLKALVSEFTDSKRLMPRTEYSADASSHNLEVLPLIKDLILLAQRMDEPYIVAELLPVLLSGDRFKREMGTWVGQLAFPCTSHPNSIYEAY